MASSVSPSADLFLSIHLAKASALARRLLEISQEPRSTGHKDDLLTSPGFLCQLPLRPLPHTPSVIPQAFVSPTLSKSTVTHLASCVFLRVTCPASSSNSLVISCLLFLPSLDSGQHLAQAGAHSGRVSRPWGSYSLSILWRVILDPTFLVH